MTDKQPIVIAIDAMGGDHAPDCVIGGLKRASEKFGYIRFLIFGDEKKVRPCIDKYGLSADVYTFVHTDNAVPPDEKPGVALRTRRESSMWMAIEAVKDGRASAVVSSGNTGALMALSKIILGTLPAIHRPAILAQMPTRHGVCTCLDLGANAQCDARNLVEFAVMGEVFSRVVMGKKVPSVALLNIGSERTKGLDEIKEAAEILENSHSDTREFKGFVEADQIGENVVDVIVSDGFSGNVMLKAIEGTAKLILRLFKDFRGSGVWGFLSFVFAIPVLLKLKKKMDPRLYNGGMLIGLKGISIKSHGGTDEIGFANAVGVAVHTVEQDLLGQITENMSKVVFPEAEAQAASDNA